MYVPKRYEYHVPNSHPFPGSKRIRPKQSALRQQHPSSFDPKPNNRQPEAAGSIAIAPRDQVHVLSYLFTLLFFFPLPFSLHSLCSKQEKYYRFRDTLFPRTATPPGTIVIVIVIVVLPLPTMYQPASLHPLALNTRKQPKTLCRTQQQESEKNKITQKIEWPTLGSPQHAMRCDGCSQHMQGQQQWVRVSNIRPRCSVPVPTPTPRCNTPLIS